jgi:hypothetical protein
VLLCQNSVSWGVILAMSDWRVLALIRLKCWQGNLFIVAFSSCLVCLHAGQKSVELARVG